MNRRDREDLAQFFTVSGFIVLNAAAIYWVMVWLTNAQIRATGRVQDGVEGVEAATVQVHTEVRELAVETARAQRLAVMIGVGTAVLGAILGGFAGAFAARLVG